MDLESAGYTDGNGWSHNGLKQVNVVMCIAGCTLAAVTYRMDQQRLLDVLNDCFVADSYRLGKEFVPLSDAAAYFWSGEREHLKATHINKWSILFVAERSGGQPDRSVVRETDANPFKPKKALSAKVCIPPYDLMGKMHADLGQGLAHVIDKKEMFLPMTNVIVSPALPNGDCEFSFVAVNKHQIVSVTELSEASQIALPVAPKVRRRKQTTAARKRVAAP